jgi:AraC family transcriptional regulator
VIYNTNEWITQELVMKKPDTLKVYQQRILKTLVYIEANIDKQLSIQELAKVSCFSHFHFQRVFIALTGETVRGYINRIRLQKAAQLIRYTEKSITEIALDIGYGTTSSFTKAFKKVIGVNPSAIRAGQVELEISAKHRLITYQEVDMKLTIEQKESKQMYFIRKTGPYEKTAPIAFKQMVDYANKRDISLKLHQLVAFAIDDPAITDKEHLRFDIGILGIKAPAAEGEFGVQMLTGGRYAVFEHHGHYNKLNQTFAKIYGHYIPMAGLELRDAQPFCHYLETNMPLSSLVTDEQKSEQITKIYIPIN